MINFKGLSACELEEYVGCEIYILHPGSDIDEYWGSIDSISPYLIHEVIDEFQISILGTVIVTDDGNEYNLAQWKFFLDKESAKKELEKIL